MAVPAIGLAADSYSAQIEMVRKNLPLLLATDDTVASMIKKTGKAVKLTDRLYRIPLAKHIGGYSAKFDPDGGVMYTGTGPKVINTTAGYIYTQYAVDLSMRNIDLTSTDEQSVLNVLRFSLDNAMKGVNMCDDIAFHQDGSGILTGYASANSTWTSGDSYTFAAATDYFGCNRLYPGMGVQSFDYDGSAANTTSTDPLIIDSVDYDNKVVYLLGTVTGEASGATGDILVYPGVAATAQSFQSTWPLSGDSFRHGLYYAHDVTTTNYFLGQLKSSNIELMPSVVNAASSGISFALMQSLLDKMVMRRDESVYKGAIGLANMSQRAKVQDIGFSMSEWPRNGKAAMQDFQPSNTNYSSTFDMCGITIRTDKRQDRSRIDLIIPDNWGRAVAHETDFYTPTGQMWFEGRNSDGHVTASQGFKIVSGYDYVCFDPGAEGYLYGLAV